MSSIPSNLSRVPNQLASQVILSNITRTSQNLLQTQIQLATGRRVNRPSDDSIAASTVSILDDIIERRDQRLRNLSHAEAVLNNIDAALDDANNLLLEAKGIASSQIGVGSDAATRASQAHVIDSILNEMVSIANRQYQQIHLFGGDATANRPIAELLGGFQYRGEGDGLRTDLGLSRSIPITMSGARAFGSLSARVEGDRDLDPMMQGSTRLADLNGGRGRGINLGTVRVDVDGTEIDVDLSLAATVQDVAMLLQTAIAAEQPGATVGIDPATRNRFIITPAAGSITITDIGGPGPAADLGLDTTFPPGGGVGGDVNPRLTQQTPLSLLMGVTVPMGTIRISNAGQSREVDLSAAENIQDVMNAIAGLDLGVRVVINNDGDRLNFVNELSGGRMSISEVSGGTTATQLGVRSLTGSTRLADWNDGRGVQVRTGSVDPVTGLPDPAADVDFRITLKNGVQIDVNLGAEDTVADVLATINAAAVAAGAAVPADFQAGLAGDGNGIALTDNTAGAPGAETVVSSMNGSFAASDLGIEGATSSATLIGEDRATVAVDSVFGHLIALRDALRANDERGITFAGERLEADLSRVTEARAEVGVRTRRVTDAVTREEDLKIQDTSLRSNARDLDYTEAAVRFSSLQQQLQAGLTTASQVTNLSLLDFLR